MTWTSIRYATELLLDGETHQLGTEPSIASSIDQFGSFVDFHLASRPATFPPEGTVVELRRVNLDTSEYITLFGGYLTGSEIDSEPHMMGLRAVDELSKFSAIRTTNDYNMTGLTEGEAWKIVADVCDVTYDDADIFDSGYVLGEHAPIYWKVGQSGQSFIEELDRVFSCKTMAVLNNRVCRIRYDRVAHSADITTTYEDGVSADFGANHLSRGDSSQKQSIWIVQGVTAPCGDDNECSCMVWAQSIDTTTLPKRGKKIQRVASSQFPKSDLIQDEVLAQAISRRLMRWYNRVPRIYTITTITDANMHPGRVVGVIDETYGIESGGTDPAFVTTVQKTGSTMTLTAIGGGGGSQGTTTSGVDKRCNSLSTDLDWGGDFTFDVDLTFPPIGGFTTWTGDFGTGWGVEGGISASACTNLKPASWTNDNDVWGPVEAGSYALVSGNWVGTVNPIESPYLGWGIEMFVDTGVDAGSDWIARIAGTHTLNAGMIALQCIDNHSGAGPFVQSIHFQVGAPGISEVTEFDTDSDFSNPAQTLDTGGFLLSVTKLGNTFTARYEAPEGVVLYEQALTSTDWNLNASGTLQLGIVSWTEGTGGSVLLDTIEVCPNSTTDYSLIGASWVNDAGDAWTISTNNLTGQPLANAVARTTLPLPERSPGLPESYRISFTAETDGTNFANRSAIDFYVEDSVTNTVEFWWGFDPFASAGVGDSFSMTGCAYNSDCVGDSYSWGGHVAGTPYACVLEFNADTFEYSITRNGDGPHVLATSSLHDGNPLRLVAISHSFGSGPVASLTNIVVEAV